MVTMRLVPLAMIALLLVSACSTHKDPDARQRALPDTRCVHYQMNRDDIPARVPVAVADTGIIMSESCKLEITALTDEPPADVVDPLASAYPRLTAAPREIAEALHVQWISIEQEPPVTHQYLVIPALTFQCWIGEAIDPSFACTGMISASHKLSTYTENAFDISGESMRELGTVNLPFTSGHEGTYTPLYPVTSDIKITHEQRSVWALLLVQHAEWERIGIARVCLGPSPRTVPCELVRARAVRSENYVMARDTGGWNVSVNAFRQLIKQPPLAKHSEPSVPSTALHSDYEGGPNRVLLGGVITGMTVGWRDSGGGQHGMDSIANISYSLGDSARPVEDDRCLEVLHVGGKTTDKPLAGMVITEGCSY